MKDYIRQAFIRQVVCAISVQFPILQNLSKIAESCQ